MKEDGFRELLRYRVGREEERSGTNQIICVAYARVALLLYCSLWQGHRSLRPTRGCCDA